LFRSVLIAKYSRLLPGLSIEGAMTLFSSARRQFLRQVSSAGIACSATSLLGNFAHGFAAEGPLQAAASMSTKTGARIFVDTRRTIAPLDRNLFGSFLEHLGRAIYEGIYDPGSKLSDGNGFRKDVLNEIRQLGVPIIRYPGGNFVSGYNWLDGVGPPQNRPRTLDKAWDTIESNQFGTNEFLAWCRAVGTEPLMGLNLGTGTPEDAAALVEYCNVGKGTRWSELRRQHGIPDPYNVQHWCLGNEMDGPWQIGHKTAHEYGRLANEVAKTLRAFDKSLELIVCGSSNSDMKTYPEWERVVLEHTYDAVDHISLHMYFANRAKNTANYLALNEKLDAYIGAIASTIEFVRASKRSRKKVTISFDEWNVWYHSNAEDREILGGNKGWPHAPRLLEDIYNFEDVLQVGCILNTFIRRSDVVKIACIAQLVNVIAPIMTEPKGAAWRQTIFYPYYFASVFGRGAALQLAVKSPGYDADVADNVPYLDISGVHDEEAGTLTFFAVNRHGAETLELAVALQGFDNATLIDHQAMTHANLEAANTLKDMHAVGPTKGSGAAVVDGALNAKLPPYSYQMYRLSVSET
jgi:alpha-N-arabinofuranosidase